MSLTNVKELEAFAAQTYARGAVLAAQKFLLNPNNDNYVDMCNSLVASRNGFSAAGVSGARILVSLPDGTTVFDSSRIGSSDVAKQNTLENANAKSINENHNSRLAIIAAMLNQSGVGTEKKYSTSTQGFEQALAHRIGKSQVESQGCIRWTLQN
jgi:hypothetical protein